jgi:hypothetical protein
VEREIKGLTLSRKSVTFPLHGEGGVLQIANKLHIVHTVFSQIIVNINFYNKNHNYYICLKCNKKIHPDYNIGHRVSNIEHWVFHLRWSSARCRCSFSFGA